MLRRSIITFSNSLATGLFVVGLGRIIGILNPDGVAWSIFVLTAGVAAVLGFRIGARARKMGSLLTSRRLASVQLLAGVAPFLNLAALYLLPIFRSGAVVGWSGVAGLIVSLMFFPMLLIATGMRLSIPRDGGTSLSVGITIMGVAAGAALVWSPEALLTPAWGIASSSALLHIAGLIAFSAQNNLRHRWYVLGAVAGLTALTSSLLASMMTREFFLVIGSV